jgi:hypothetical protein
LPGNPADLLLPDKYESATKALRLPIGMVKHWTHYAGTGSTVLSRLESRINDYANDADSEDKE